MAHNPRALPFGTRFTQADLTAIGDHVGDVVTRAVRAELVRAGLTVESDEGVLAVQQDHAFLRAARLRAEDAHRAILHGVIRWAVPLLCTALVAGLAVMVGHRLF